VSAYCYVLLGVWCVTACVMAQAFSCVLSLQGFGLRLVFVAFLMDRFVLGQVLLQELWFPPVSIIPPVLYTHSPINMFICLSLMLQQLTVWLKTLVHWQVTSVWIILNRFHYMCVCVCVCVCLCARARLCVYVHIALLWQECHNSKFGIFELLV